MLPNVEPRYFRTFAPIKKNKNISWNQIRLISPPDWTSSQQSYRKKLNCWQKSIWQKQKQMFHQDINETELVLSQVRDG